jgi:hypothetical protein
VGALPHGGADSVGGEDDPSAQRRFLFRLDEDRAPALEIAHDVDVVDDLLADVDRRAPQSQGLPDGVDGTLHARAIAVRRGQDDALSTPGGRHGAETKTDRLVRVELPSRALSCVIVPASRTVRRARPSSGRPVRATTCPDWPARSTPTALPARPTLVARRGGV